MRKTLKVSLEEGRPPVVARAGDETFVRRITHAARQDVISIPRGVLSRLGLRKGDLVLLWVEGSTICFRSVKLDQIRREVFGR